MGFKTGPSAGKPPTVASVPTFASRLLWGLVAAVLVGAVLLVLSVVRPNRGVDELAETPRVVLVAMSGTPEQPGFAGFLAILNPASRVVKVVPVPGTLPVVAPSDPLWSEAPRLTPRQIAAVVGRDLHIPVSGYFIVDAPEAQAVLSALAASAPGWPAHLTSDQLLRALGWPYGIPGAQGQLDALQAIITGLPELPPSQDPLLNVALKASHTNLSLYQMFMLATYIRGDTLELAPAKGVGR
ncbi:MAG: hypothetical protein K6V97_03000 [Actinomycetia bacterium]|nr:hypothetical protein [Actinomycetes bacterium]